MDVSESTESIPEVAVTSVVCTTTGSSSKIPSGYFGKVGMRYFHKLMTKFFCPKINIEKLWSLLPQEAKDKASKDNAPLIDVTQFGYFKVLGKGVSPLNQPFVVKAKLISKIYDKKIKESGGVVVLTA